MKKTPYNLIGIGLATVIGCNQPENLKNWAQTFPTNIRVAAHEGQEVIRGEYEFFINTKTNERMTFSVQKIPGTNRWQVYEARGLDNPELTATLEERLPLLAGELIQGTPPKEIVFENQYRHGNLQSVGVHLPNGREETYTPSPWEGIAFTIQF